MSFRTSVAETLPTFLLEFVRASPHHGDFTLTATWSPNQKRPAFPAEIVSLRDAPLPVGLLYFSARSKYLRAALPTEPCHPS